MSQEIQAIRFDVEDIGKHVKGSKKRFSWTFGLNGRNHTIILDFSYISSKIKLVIDRKTILETELPANSSFQHPFTMDGYAVNILQQGETFEVRINNKVFSHLYNQAKTNTQFRNYEDEVKDIKVNESTFQNSGKTVKLNIGALDGAKKKTKQNTEGQNWGNQLSMPSYFGDQPEAKTTQKKQVKKSSSLLDEDDTSAQSSESSQEKKTEQSQSGQVDFFASEKTSTSPSQQHLQSIMHQQQQATNASQFNTMQNMFATINLTGQPAPQLKQEMSGLDLLGSLPSPSTGTANTGDYSTMQMLFATGLQGSGLPSAPQTLAQANTIPSGMALPTDFNTMQNLFATNNLGGFPSPVQPVQPNATAMNTNFYSVGNLYATGNLSQPLEQPSNNLNFATGSNLGVQNVSLASSQVPSTGIQNVNIQDFNTMQNLFKTGGAPVLPPPASSEPHDPFSVLSMPHTAPAAKIESTSTAPSNSNVNMGMFNTYSGSKSSAPVLDASSFGTMQKGQPVADFLQALPTQPPQEVPNFSKKKQPVEQDLI